MQTTTEADTEVTFAGLPLNVTVVPAAKPVPVASHVWPPAAGPLLNGVVVTVG